MDELKRIAELLRPLWPGVVMELDPKRSIPAVRVYGGTCGCVQVAVVVAEDGRGSFVATVAGAPIGIGVWASADLGDESIRVATLEARTALDDLLLALGLEVADVAR